VVNGLTNDVLHWLAQLCLAQVFRCHKAILAARSPVFRAMLATPADFAHSMAATAVSTWLPQLPWCCGSVLALVTELLAAGDKYDVPSLNFLW
jgi:hypothetical protein